MTICLRAFALNFHTKLIVLGTPGQSARSSHTTTMHRVRRSSFLYEFLDGRQGAETLQVAPQTVVVSHCCHQNSELLVQLPSKSLMETNNRISRSFSEISPWTERPVQLQYSKYVNRSDRHNVSNCVASQIEQFHLKCLPLTELERSMILTADTSASSKHRPPPMEGKPTEDQLEKIFKVLSENLPRLFIRSLNYRIYHKDLIFQNNIRGQTTYGLSAYVSQMALLRLLGHLKFAYVKMEVLKMTKHPEDGTIRVRWRIRGVSGLRIFVQFWKFRVWNYSEMMNKESDWYDGYSTFYVASDGLVHKHVCDKMMPDDDKVKQPSKANLAAKLAFLLGAIPKPSLEDLAAVTLAIQAKRIT